MTETASAAPEYAPAAVTDPAALLPARPWLAPAWFLLGVLVGILGFAAFARLTAAPPVAAPDAVAIREAARDGTLDAIATVQAGGAPAESRATSTPVVVQTAFAARPANQTGNQAASVTIVEFSDFQ